MGLLAKTNPAATFETVRRAAMIGAAVSALLYAALVVCSRAWSQSPANWSFAIAIPLTLAGAFLFGLLEWQPPDMPDVGDVLLHCELKFAIKLDTQRFLPVDNVSVGDLNREVLDAIRSQHPADLVDEAVVWIQLRDLIVERLGVDKDEVSPEARFLYELA